MDLILGFRKTKKEAADAASFVNCGIRIMYCYKRYPS